jgi:hypothetical protein
MMLHIRPRNGDPVAGEGDHLKLAQRAKGGGGGVARDASLSTKEKRQGLRPFHHPSRFALGWSPFPLAWGRMKKNARAAQTGLEPAEISKYFRATAEGVRGPH